MLPLLLVTMVSCGLKDTLWNENSDVSLNLEKNILQQVNRNVFADKKAEETDESKVVNFVCTISGDYSNTQTQSVDFANEVNTVSFTFENLPVGGIIDVEMVLILESTGDELYRGKTESVKVLSNNATKVQIRLSKASEKLKDLFYPKKNVKICDWNDDWIDTGDSQNEIQDFYKEKVQDDGQLLDWCFDENGEVIYLYHSYTNNGRVVGKYNELIADNPWKEGFWRDNEVNMIAYDKVTKFIYCLCNHTVYVFDSTAPNKAYSGYFFDTAGDEDYIISSIAAHNGILYIAYKKSYMYNDEDLGTEVDVVTNWISSYSIPTDLITIDDEIELDTHLQNVQILPDEFGYLSNCFDKYFKITDLEVQGGALIALFTVNNSNEVCTGGILKINPDSLRIEKINNNRFIGAKTKTKDYVWEEALNYRKYSDSCYYLGGSTENAQLYKEGGSDFTQTNIPYSLCMVKSAGDTSCFVGPQKFMAIKPKKLVILDSGYFIWDEENTFNKLQRFVTVDLENYIFTQKNSDEEFCSIDYVYPTSSSGKYFIEYYTNFGQFFKESFEINDGKFINPDTELIISLPFSDPNY